MTSIIKVDDVQNQPGTNIINKCGTDITIGQSGDTVALASGASQSGFGRSGSVNWDTSSIKTSGFTAVSGNGYFCNTTSGEFTLTLPTSPTAGDIVGLKDYANTFDTNKLTIGRGGSDIEGIAADVTVTTEGQALLLVYVDATAGWKLTAQADNADVGFPEYVAATGGTPCAGVTCGDFKVHIFNGPGTFCVSNGGNACGSTTVTGIVVAGGGGGGSFFGGAGGAGGLVWESDGYTVSASPGAYAIAVGGGGAGPPSNPTNGNPGANSTGLGYTANGGGAGGGGGGSADAGGSGGGAGGNNPPHGPGNQPGVSNPGATNYGNPGGPMTPNGGSGGGGAGGAGATGPSGLGGVGIDVSPGFGTQANIGAGDVLYTSEMWFAGGGGGQGNYGGKGGGSLRSPCVSPAPIYDAQANTGGGARGDGNYAGAPGIVLIRYKFQ